MLRPKFCVLQPSLQCDANELGNVYRVYDDRSRVEYITQEEHISVFSHKIKNIEEYERYIG